MQMGEVFKTSKETAGTADVTQPKTRTHFWFVWGMVKAFGSFVSGYTKIASSLTESIEVKGSYALSRAARSF